MPKNNAARITQADLPGTKRTAYNLEATREILRHISPWKPEKIIKALNNGANPNRKMQNGMTMLHFATTHNNPELVRLLIQNGAELQENNYCRDPLYFAESNREKNGEKYQEVLNILLEFKDKGELKE